MMLQPNQLFVIITMFHMLKASSIIYWQFKKVTQTRFTKHHIFKVYLVFTSWLTSSSMFILPVAGFQIFVGLSQASLYIYIFFLIFLFWLIRAAPYGTHLMLYSGIVLKCTTLHNSNLKYLTINAKRLTDHLLCPTCKPLKPKPKFRLVK